MAPVVEHGNFNATEGNPSFVVGIVISTTFVYLAAGVDDSQMAIASTGLYLSANIGTLVGASLTNNILQTTLKAGLEQKLRGWEGGMEVWLLIDSR